MKILGFNKRRDGRLFTTAACYNLLKNNFTANCMILATSLKTDWKISIGARVSPKCIIYSPSILIWVVAFALPAILLAMQL